MWMVLWHDGKSYQLFDREGAARAYARFLELNGMVNVRVEAFG